MQKSGHALLLEGIEGLADSVEERRRDVGELVSEMEVEGLSIADVIERLDLRLRQGCGADDAVRLAALRSDLCALAEDEGPAASPEG